MLGLPQRSLSPSLSIGPDMLQVDSGRVAGLGGPASAGGAGSGDAASDAATENFLMHCYKVVPCGKRFRHDWSVCPFAHNNEMAARRDPRLYVPIFCFHSKQRVPCPRGDACPHAHNLFEYWLHPLRYRTEMCQFGAACSRPVCFFAHSPQQLRHTGIAGGSQPVVAPPEALLPGGAGPALLGSTAAGAAGAGTMGSADYNAAMLQLLQLQQQQQHQPQGGACRSAGGPIAGASGPLPLLGAASLPPAYSSTLPASQFSQGLTEGLSLLQQQQQQQVPAAVVQQHSHSAPIPRLSPDASALAALQMQQGIMPGQLPSSSPLVPQGPTPDLLAPHTPDGSTQLAGQLVPPHTSNPSPQLGSALATMGSGLLARTTSLSPSPNAPASVATGMPMSQPLVSHRSDMSLHMHSDASLRALSAQLSRAQLADGSGSLTAATASALMGSAASGPLGDSLDISSTLLAALAHQLSAPLPAVSLPMPPGGLAVGAPATSAGMGPGACLPTMAPLGGEGSGSAGALPGPASPSTGASSSRGARPGSAPGNDSGSVDVDLDAVDAARASLERSYKSAQLSNAQGSAALASMGAEHCVTSGALPIQLLPLDDEADSNGHEGSLSSSPAGTARTATSNGSGSLMLAPPTSGAVAAGNSVASAAAAAIGSAGSTGGIGPEAAAQLLASLPASSVQQLLSLVGQGAAVAALQK